MHCEPVRQRRGASLGALPISKCSMPTGGVSRAAAGDGSAAAARFAQRPGRMRGRVRADDNRERPAGAGGSGRSAAGSSTSLRREWRATTGSNTLARTHARADPGFERIGSPGGTPSERIGGGGLVPKPLAGQSSTLDLIAAATAAAHAWTTRWCDVARAHCHGRRQRDAPPPPPPRARCHRGVISHARAHAAAAAAAAACIWMTR